MHQSFVTTAPHRRGTVGDSRVKLRGNYFIAPAMQGKFLGFDIKILTPGRFSIVNDKVKSMVLTFMLSPVDGFIA